MICPKCGRNLLVRELVKANVKGFDNVDIVYDAFCPACKAEIGRMFWGELTLKKDRDEALPDSRLVYLCPHCHKPLPHDLNELPVDSRSADRRRGQRRQGERRKVNLGWFGGDRRRAERRQKDRRVMDRRSRATLAEAEPQAREERRRGERRKTQKPMLFDRRAPGRDRRKSENDP